jgi:hypothetical protein
LTNVPDDLVFNFQEIRRENSLSKKNPLILYVVSEGVSERKSGKIHKKFTK